MRFGNDKARCEGLRVSHSTVFWDRMAERYSKRPLSDPKAYAHKLERTRAYLNSDMEVLELGCGTGSTALEQAPFVKSIEAVDISQRMLEIARGKADLAGVTNVAFTQAALESLVLEEGRYDMIMAHSLLHLLDDRKVALEKIHRALKPGGHFVSSTVCLDGGMPWLRLVLPLGRWTGLLPKVVFLTPAALIEEVEAVGCPVEETWQPTPHSALFLIARKI